MRAKDWLPFGITMGVIVTIVWVAITGFRLEVRADVRQCNQLLTLSGSRSDSLHIISVYTPCRNWGRE